MHVSSHTFALLQYGAKVLRRFTQSISAKQLAIVYCTLWKFCRLFSMAQWLFPFMRRVTKSLKVGLNSICGIKGLVEDVQ